jgi:tetratricopeptide (TPR) repeat protein
MRLIISSVLALTAVPALAEQGVLVLHVKDVHNKPVIGVRFRAGGDSSVSPPTQPQGRAAASGPVTRAISDSYGQARIQLSIGAKVGDPVILEIVASDRDLVFISPWDEWVSVPPFDDKPASFVEVVLGERNDRTMLENGDAIRSIVSQVNRAQATSAAPRAKDSESGPRQSTGVNAPGSQNNEDPLTEVAKKYGLQPSDVDDAIRRWGAQTKDPYERALAEFYSKEYPSAERDFSDLLNQAEQEAARARLKVANRAASLADTLYAQSKYRDAIAAYRKAIDNNPSEPAYQIGYATALVANRQSPEAKGILTDAINALRKSSDFSSVSCQQCLANACHQLARAYSSTNRPKDAEQAYLNELNIFQELAKRYPGQFMTYIAERLDDLATLYSSTEQLRPAEDRLLEALKVVNSMAGGPGGSADLFTELNEDLAGVYLSSRRRDEAIVTYRSAATVLERTINVDSRTSDTAVKLNRAGELRLSSGDYAAAIGDWSKALAILSGLPTSDSDSIKIKIELQRNWDDLGRAHFRKEEYAEAEDAYDKALGIARALPAADPHYLHRLVSLLGGVGTRPFGMVHTEIRLNNPDAAAKYASEAVGVYTKLQSAGMLEYNDFLSIKVMSEDLGRLYQRLKLYDDAVEQAREAVLVAQQEAKLYDDSIGQNDLMDEKAFLSEIYSDAGRFQEAEGPIVEAVQVCRTICIPFELTINLTREGVAYQGERKFADAEVAYVEATKLWRMIGAES